MLTLVTYPTSNLAQEKLEESRMRIFLYLPTTTQNPNVHWRVHKNEIPFKKKEVDKKKGKNKGTEEEDPGQKCCQNWENGTRAYSYYVY